MHTRPDRAQHQVSDRFHSPNTTAPCQSQHKPPTDSRKDMGYVIPNTGDPDGTIPRAWYSGTSKPSLHTFLSSGLDALIISLPLTPSTKNLFSTEEFELLGKSNPPADEPNKKSSSCFLINIARGGLVDQPALVTALNDEVRALLHSLRSLTTPLLTSITLVK